MRRQYIEKRFRAESLAIIEQANSIIREYAAEGFDLTLRQVYYQFVARDLVPNTERSYKRLGSIISDARLAGLMDWDMIVDRTRFVRSLSHWSTPGSIIESAAASYRVDHWRKQEYRPEVWIEKDALIGVIADVCEEYDVPYFSCRGYVSQSEMWAGAQRLIDHSRYLQTPIIFHFGDHDPSGIDMTRDIRDRMKLFEVRLEDVKRLALNMDQIDEYDPPPNPAKLSDSRAQGYIVAFGDDSWELDALEPRVIVELVRDAIVGLIDWDAWEKSHKEEERSCDLLKAVSKNWTKVAKMLKRKED